MSEMHADKENAKRGRKPKKRKAGKILDQNLGIETLRTCHDCYRELKSGNAIYLSDVASNLGIDPNVLHRRIERFEQAIQGRGNPDFRLFSRRRGSKASAIDDPALEQRMSDVADVIRGYDRVIHSQLPTIRLGASLAACRFFAPLLANFCSNREVVIDITHAKPSVLRDMAERRECDLVLVALPNDVHPPEGCWCEELQLALICPRGHWLEYEKANYPSVSRRSIWQRMADNNECMVVLKETPTRYPMPRYPLNEFPPELRIHRAESTLLLHSIVCSTSKPPSLCISLPQFLTEEELEKLYVADVGLARVKMVLLRPGRPAENERAPNRTKTDLINVLEDTLRQKLNSVVRQPKASSQEKYFYHVTQSGSEQVWLLGRLTWHFDNRFVSGFYRTKWSESVFKYFLRGHYVESKERFHLVCKAFSSDHELEDEFVLSCIYESDKQIKDGKICGVWSGRRVWGTSDYAFSPLSGCVVIASKPMTASDLNEEAENYFRRYKIGVPLCSANTILDNDMSG
jgi:hypothetical protein